MAKSKGFLVKLRGLHLNASTRKAINTVNARVRKWKSEGVDEDTIKDYVSSAAKIEGVALRDGKLVIEKDLNRFSEAQLKSALPTFKEFKAVSSSIEDKVKEAKLKSEKEAENLRAELAFKAEIKRLGDQAADELWDIWYSDHDSKERRVSISQLDTWTRAELADKIVDMGRLLAKGVGNAVSVEEIYELIEEIQAAVGG